MLVKERGRTEPLIRTGRTGVQPSAMRCQIEAAFYAIDQNLMMISLVF